MGAAELRLGEGEFTWQIPANHGPAARIDGSILIKEDTLLNLDCYVGHQICLHMREWPSSLETSPPSHILE